MTAKSSKERREHAVAARKTPVPLACGHTALYREYIITLDSPYWCRLCQEWRDHARKHLSRKKGRR